MLRQLNFLGSGLAERVLSDDFEDDSIELVSPIVEPELALLEVQVEGFSRDAMELHQPSFRKGPEGLDAVDVAAATGEFVLPVLDPVVLLVAEIDEAVIAPPPIGMNDAVLVDSAPDNGLQRGFRAIRHDLGVDLPLSLEDSEHWRFAESPASTFALNPFAAEVRFVDFDFAREGRLPLTKLGNSLSDEKVIAVDRIAVEASERGGLTGVQVQGETPYEMPEFGL